MVMDPVSDLEPVYQQLPDLRQVPLVTKETVVVGVPIGMKDFVDDAIRKVFADCEQFQKLIQFPFANCFILLLCYCCNQKLMYLMRNIFPTIMLQHAHYFDNKIQSLFYNNFKLSLINLTSASVLEGNELDASQIIQLANFQIRDAEERGGFGLKSMASISIPAFTAATFCHIFSTNPLLLQGQTILDLALPQPLALQDVNILFDPSTQTKNFLLSKAIRECWLQSKQNIGSMN
jgi:hypothetical protein